GVFEEKKCFLISSPVLLPLTQFDLVLIRKEPPFDATYLYLTQILETTADQVPMVNHPRGIRNANEKLAILNFSSWIPETLVTNSAEKIIDFQKRIQDDLVIKPLNLMAGKNIIRLKFKSRTAARTVRKATRNSREFVMAQRFLKGRGKTADKRILILDGDVLTAFEKCAPKGDFRSNLSLGATARSTKLTAKEMKLVKELKPYLLREGLRFVGIDVLCERLIEINVTCPSGLVEARDLYPQRGLAAAWAGSLEKFASCRGVQISGH
ncbi:MAG TPA: glutathione synthase, partial [bacterium]|nr:glutathione synthase [bacterium]